jgi:hypothetical protein
MPKQKPEVRYIAIEGLPIVGHSVRVLPAKHPSPLVTGDGIKWAITSPVVRFWYALDGLCFETQNTVYIPGGAA